MAGKNIKNCSISSIPERVKSKLQGHSDFASTRIAKINAVSSKCRQV